jgi:hypothetical protein
MKDKKNESTTPRLEVYLNRSVLFDKDGDATQFDEGVPTATAKLRLETIRKELGNGFLSKIIDECKKLNSISIELDSSHIQILTGLVDSVTSEVGRAIVGLTVLQLCVKSITPEQSIRLHKSGGGGANFSWREGIPMRVLDKNFITPTLREHDLLKLNADGFMMTRSLAENYPYSKLYKAAIRGARREWLELVDLIEEGDIDPRLALKNLVAMLLNRSEKFSNSARIALDQLSVAVSKVRSIKDVVRFLRDFIDAAPYSARLFEVSMHSLFQVLDEDGVFGGSLKPLSQMRSANKKHGNIGDIEIVKKIGGMEILEAWDAKYGKADVRDELEELNEKLSDHSETETAGFVVDQKPRMKSDITARLKELEVMHEVSIQILSFEEWVDSQISRTTNDPLKVAKRWLVAFGESICQKRRAVAPIDEPCDSWVVSLAEFSRSWK